MSTEQKPKGEANVESNDQHTEKTANETVSMEDLLRRTAELESQNRRLLDESKKYKSNWQKIKEEQAAKEQKTLEEQGRYKDLYAQKDQEYKSLVQSLMREKVSSAVKMQASRYGCVDETALLKLGNSELLQYDEETQAVHGVDAYLEDAKTKFPFLFKQSQTPSVNNAQPQGVVTQPKPKTAKEYISTKEGWEKTLAELI